MEFPWSQLPVAWGATSTLSMQLICLCGRLAGWGICLSVCCWCAYAWGRSAGAPPPVALALSMQEPQDLHFARVLWPCGFVCVCMCVFLGAVACVSLCLCGFAVVAMSPHHPCVRWGSVSVPLLVLCPWLSQREAGLRCSSTNKPVSHCISPARADSREGKPSPAVQATFQRPLTLSQPLHPLHPQIHIPLT